MEKKTNPKPRGDSAFLRFFRASLFVSNTLIAAVLGVSGCSALWSILELFQQRERVRKGWFPKNPKRADSSE